MNDSALRTTASWGAPRGASRVVSDGQLELYIDGALAPEHSTIVEHAIATSPADAVRLAELRVADEQLRAALLAAPAPVVGQTRQRPMGVFAAAAAAVALLGVGAAIWFGRAGGVPAGPEAPAPVGVADAPAATPEYAPVRVVLSLPVPVREGPQQGHDRKKPAALAPPTAPPTPTPAASAIASAFNDASDAGIRRAVSAINGASPEDRAAALTTLGQSLRSGSTAVRILDRLERRDQVAVCSELALDTGLRSVALQRLRELTEDSIVGPDARAAARALASAPGMKAWLRSYGLLEPELSDPATGAPAVAPVAG